MQLGGEGGSGFTWITAFLSALGKFFAWRSASSHSLMTYTMRKHLNLKLSILFPNIDLIRLNIDLMRLCFSSIFVILNIKINYHIHSYPNIWHPTKM